MNKQTFEQSKSDGHHKNLLSLSGEWEGVIQTWFEPEKLADESRIEGTIQPLLDGRFIIHEYKSHFQNKPFEGIAIYGYHLDKGVYESIWIDSFHMGTGMMFSKGSAVDKGFSVLGNYFVGFKDDGTESYWGWKTVIVTPEPDKLIITSYNISPEGEEAKGVEITYSKKFK